MQQLHFDFINEEEDLVILQKVNEYSSPTKAAEALNIPRSGIFMLINKYTQWWKDEQPKKKTYKEALVHFLNNYEEKPVSLATGEAIFEEL